jgi:hypothetical protein
MTYQIERKTPATRWYAIYSTSDDPQEVLAVIYNNYGLEDTITADDVTGDEENGYSIGLTNPSTGDYTQYRAVKN